MKLALDHHFTTRLATALRERDHDVAAAIEKGWHDLEDSELFERCVADGRAVLTNNARDFVPLVREWAAEGRSHRGLLLTDDSSWPRAMEGVGRSIDALDALLSQYPDDDAFADRVHWL